MKTKKELERDLKRIKKQIEMRENRKKGDSPYPVDDISQLSSSILTRTQREFLLGQYEPAHPLSVRSRIRDRHVMGILDLITLSECLSQSEKDKVTSELRETELDIAINYLQSLKKE